MFNKGGETNQKDLKIKCLLWGQLYTFTVALEIDSLCKNPRKVEEWSTFGIN